jgi:hypothetical protein
MDPGYINALLHHQKYWFLDDSKTAPLKHETGCKAPLQTTPLKPTKFGGITGTSRLPGNFAENSRNLGEFIDWTFFFGGVMGGLADLKSISGSEFLITNAALQISSFGTPDEEEELDRNVTMYTQVNWTAD